MGEGQSPLFPLVFTDLDGSLLDHHTYKIDPAKPALALLASMNVPVVPCTSKTRSELIALRRDLGLQGAFVVENGAACYVPKAQCTVPPASFDDSGDYWVRSNGLPRAHWLEILDQLRQDFSGEFSTFSEVGASGIMELTQLSKIEAERANAREFSEPVHWMSSDARKAMFIQRLEGMGASVLQGGRFLSVASAVNKGQALTWVQALFAEQHPHRETTSLAIGDSGNDIAMLEAADWALIIRSPVHSPPRLQRQTNYFLSALEGPAGWNQGVMQWLSQLGLLPDDYPISV